MTNIDRQKRRRLARRSSLLSKRIRTLQKSVLKIFNSPQAFVALYLITITVFFFPSLSRRQGTKLRGADDITQSSNSEVNPPGTCILNLNDMPELWRPTKALTFLDSTDPWSKDEERLCVASENKGLDELINFFDEASEEQILELGTDATNCLIDNCYTSTSDEAFRQRACEAASRVMQISVQEYVSDNAENFACEDVYEKVKFLGYAQYLINILPSDEGLRTVRSLLVERVRKSFDDCGSISNIVDGKPKRKGRKRNVFKTLSKPNQEVEVVWEWNLWSVALTDIMTVPELSMPKGTDEFVSRVWTYVQGYQNNVPNARDVEEGFDDAEAMDAAFLATHLAYIPTGYGRHFQYIKDLPWLYSWIRENFYAAMETEYLDLIAEFIDLLRQYGCDEDNDAQVRHGARYLLKLYRDAGYSWVDHRGEDEGDEVTDYNRIHKPWTAVSGVGRRIPEPVVPGSYGYAFQKALERAAASKTADKHNAGPNVKISRT